MPNRGGIFLSEHLFSGSYWRAAADAFRSLRMVVFAALICALTTVVTSLFIPVGENLRVMFTYLVVSVGAIVYGPLMAVAVGAVSDVLGFLLAPSGPWFFGYTLSSMVAGLCYGLVFFHRKPSVLRLFASRLIVNYGVNVTMGSLWSAMLYGKGYLYYLAKSLVKNTIVLPIEVLLLGAVFALVLPAFGRLGLLPRWTQADAARLRRNNTAAVVFGLDLLVAAMAAAYFSTTVEAGRFYQVFALCIAAAGTALLVGHALRVRAVKE